MVVAQYASLFSMGQPYFVLHYAISKADWPCCTIDVFALLLISTGCAQCKLLCFVFAITVLLVKPINGCAISYFAISYFAISCFALSTLLTQAALIASIASIAKRNPFTVLTPHASLSRVNKSIEIYQLLCNQLL